MSSQETKETPQEKFGRKQPEEHGHIHYVKYKTKSGTIKIYRYVYGKAIRKSLVKQVRER